MFFTKYWYWAILSFILLGISCTEDDPFRSDEIIVSPPDLRLSDDEKFVARNDTIEYNCPFILELDGQKGDFSMSTLTITVDSVLLDPSKILISNEAATNPFSLPSSATDGFLFEIQITPEAVAQQEVEYIFEVTDSLGTSEDISINLMTVPSLKPELSTFSAFEQAVQVDSTIFISVEGKSSCADMTSLSFYRDGILLESSEIRIGNTSIESNPWMIDDTKFFSESFNFVGISSADSFFYEIILEDVAGSTDTVSYRVRTGTKIVIDEDIRLSNFDTETATVGDGIDLEEGAPDTVFENLDIQASGIDATLDQQNNWIPQIRALNGSEIGELRLGENGLSENFDIADIKLKEDLETLFNLTVLVPDQSYTKVAKFEEYIVKQDTNYYMIEIRGITIDTSSNNDYIDINIWK